MSILDTYYRAFKDYRKQTKDNTLCEKDRKAIAQTDTDGDKLEATKYLCHIDEDWIKAIEEGLEFVEKAVQEERQFIRTNGEVVPIEKIKRISKDSVEHLAKHSEMITHVPEEEDEQLIPDKLYMVEKLSDYAVYENRFLYMMLSYLQNFINFRLEKIEILRRTYMGEFAVSKEITGKNRTLVIQSKISEKRTDNPFPVADENSAKLVQRIKDCQQIVMSLLATDLMTQVAKTPMIKPPIVKTNVLKMNNNFKRALALYDYIATYKGLGYTYEEVKYDFAPYSEKIADEIAETVNLTAFTAYKFGNEIEDILETSYRNEETRLKEEEAKKLDEKIKRLKKRALESNKTLEEYMVLLEERNRMLEKDCEELVNLRQELENLGKTIDELNHEKNDLNRRIGDLEAVIEDKEREIAELNQKYIEDMAAAKREHDEAVANLNAEHEQEVYNLQTEFTQKIENTISEYEQKVGEMRSETDRLKLEHEQAMQECEDKKASLDEQIRNFNDDFEAKVKEIRDKFQGEFDEKEKVINKNIEDIKNENTFIKGQLDSMRIQQGHLTPSHEYSSRERFIELEAEYAAFEKFFKEQWKLTKKQIRKQVLWAKPEKKNKKPKN